MWTETGKGDRLGGNGRLGPSPPSEWPAPPHSLHRTSRTIPKAGQLHMPACCATVPGPHLPCLVACPCHDHMPAAPVCIVPCHHPTMCARIIQKVFCKDCPAGSPIIHHSLCFCILSIHSRGARDCIEQPATSLFLHKSHFKWPVGRRMACPVRVSCLQQLRYERKKKKKVR